jgi:transposase-like protein
MSLINHEELKKQLVSGEITSLDDITNEFKNILKEVIQTATQEELTAHLGYDKHQESTTSNYRNGYNEKTIKSKYGNINVSIPRDRNSSFEPQLVKKREVLLDGSEDLILSLYTKGMSVREIYNTILMISMGMNYQNRQYQILLLRLLKKPMSGRTDHLIQYIQLFLWMLQY